jgi:hypothetical protein
MVVVELNDCQAPRLSTEAVDSTAVPEHGDKLQRFARREILSARNELIRTNPYWRTYEGSRWVVDYVRWRNRRTLGPELLGNSPASRLAQFARLAASRMQ